MCDLAQLLLLKEFVVVPSGNSTFYTTHIHLPSFCLKILTSKLALEEGWILFWFVFCYQFFENRHSLFVLQ